MTKHIKIKGKARPYRATLLALSRWEDKHDRSYIELMARGRLSETIDLHQLALEEGAKYEGQEPPQPEDLIKWLDEEAGLYERLNDVAIDQIVKATAKKKTPPKKKTPAPGATTGKA